MPQSGWLYRAASSLVSKSSGYGSPEATCYEILTPNPRPLGPSVAADYTAIIARQMVLNSKGAVQVRANFPGDTSAAPARRLQGHHFGALGALIRSPT